MLELCQQTAHRMSVQIEDILAYSGVTEPQSSPEPINMNVLVREVLQDLSGILQSAGADVQLGELQGFIGHRTQIRLLVQNLIENAVKYRDPQRPLVISVSCTNLGPEPFAIIRVADNGIGIAPEFHAKIFSLFQRLHLREDIGGSGLGLCTCLRVARNHNGSIRVSSEPGEGSVFTAELQSLTTAETILREAA